MKYSPERLREVADMDLKASERQGVLMEIETLGAEGLRYRTHLPRAKTKGWVTQSAFKVDCLKDAAGSGDLCTAAVLRKLARGGVKGLLRTTAAAIVEAVRVGQAWAAWNCGFAGARGGMYEVRREAAHAQVKEILQRGEVSEPPVETHASTSYQLLSHLCPACKKQDSAVPLQGRKATAG